jgi:hypothetical protein
MPRFHARHTTEIRYSRAISQSVTEVRLTPLADGRQRLEWSSLRAEPAVRIEAGRDDFGNAVHRFALPRAHDALMVESVAMVETRPAEIAPEGEAVGLEAVAGPAYSEAYAAYLLPSRHVRWQEPVDSLARSLSLPEGDGLAAWLRAAESAAFHPVNHRGAGDSMTGAIAAGMAAGLSPEEILRLAVAAAALNVTRHGLGSGDSEAIGRLAARVDVSGWPSR